MFCYVSHRQAAHPAETVMVERFQFGPVFFFQCPAFTSPKLGEKVPPDFNVVYGTSINRSLSSPLAPLLFPPLGTQKVRSPVTSEIRHVHSEFRVRYRYAPRVRALFELW
jgi:hypothetical protein